MTTSEQSELERLVRRLSMPQVMAASCRMILLDKEDLTYEEIGKEQGLREQTVLKWSGRF